MTDTFTADPSAQLLAQAANDYLSPVLGSVHQPYTFAEWNTMFGRSNEPMAELDLTAKITFGEWVAAATGWKGYVINHLLTHFFRLGMTTIDGLDEAVKTFVSKTSDIKSRHYYDYGSVY